jgi:hypothetical protein
MRITVSHNKSKDQIIQAVDRSFDDLFKGTPLVPVQVTNEQRKWQGSTLAFSFNAKMGLLSAPIKGTVEVTDRDLTIDADLGLLERLLGGGVGRATLESRVKGLLT